MKKLLPFVFITLFLTSFTFGQDGNTGLSYCGTTEVRQRIFDDVYNWKLQDSLDQINLEEFTRHYEESQAARDRGVVYVIPVVFHIVHLGGVENISDYQVYDAIRILNEDFRKQNSDTTAIVTAFKGIAGDAEIEFRLATKDPQGNCHKGITRTYSSNTYDTGQTFSGHPIIDDVVDEHGAWPSNKYMNIYVCIDPSGAAGYTNTPNSWQPINSGYAGILISHSYVGAIGTGTTQRSRALTHEVGHWLNLQHTWGPNNSPGDPNSCTTDDGVTDTPNTIGWTTCSLTGTTCGSLDNVQNYMEYSYCSRMFTQGQITRMRAALNSSTGGRNNLWTTANLNATGVNGTPILCAADFDADKTMICAGYSITFEDRSYHNATGRTWTFPGGTASSTTDSVVTVTYNTPGVYSVSLDATDGTSTQSLTKTDYITVLPLGAKGTPTVEGWETGTVVADDWFLTNPSGNKWQVTNLAAATGTYSLYIDNASSMEGEIHEIVSTTYGLQFNTDLTISFKHAFAQRNTGTADVLKLSVSSNCGESWSTRKTLSGSGLATAPITSSEFVPTSLQWEETVVTNVTSFFFSPEFRLKFEFNSDGGNNIFLDDINITGTVGIIHIDKDYFNLSVYPNPSNGTDTRITFDLDALQKYSLNVIDPLGKNVMTLANGVNGTGHQTFDLNKNQLASGLYFIRLQIGDQIITERLIIQ